MRIQRIVALLLLASCLSAPAVEKPNIIFFAVDDLCDWVGALGHRQAVTPNMDALAKAGVTFTNAHTAGVFCAPSRSAIFTGQHASTTGCYTTEVYFYEHPERQPLQTTFQKGGYRTFGAGKLFHHPAGYLDLRGWDTFFLRNKEQKAEGWPLDSWGDDTPKPDPFPNSVFNKGREIKGGLFLEWAALPNASEKDMADTIRTDWACDILDRKHDKPFFLAVGLYAPHFPNYVPQKYFDLYDADKIVPPAYKTDDLDDLPPRMRKIKTNRSKIHQRLVELDAVEKAIHGYLASVSYADAMLGRVMKALAASPHKDKTVIVLWSDHGYHHGEKGDWGKHTLWERTSNVPFIWAGPGITAGAVVDTTVSLIDMYPTFVEMCGLPRVKGLEGTSIAAPLRDPKTATDRNVYLPYMDPGGYAIINQNWRYIRYSDDTEELYNVRTDPNEWHNLAEDNAQMAIKQELRASAPDSFAPTGTPRKGRKLVFEGDTFRWDAR